MATESRKYAAWNPGYAGAPPKLGVYYSITLFLVIGATSFHLFPRFAQIAMMPFQFGGLFAWLYRPVVRRRVLPMRDEPAAAPQYAVRIALSRGVTYGEDEGLVSFVDGWLVYQGRGCAFSLRSADVRAAVSSTTLTFDGACRPHLLVFSHAESDFGEAWDTWRGQRPPAGTTVFPPVQPLPRHEGWDHALTALALGLLIGSWVLWGFGAWPYVLAVLLALVWLSRGASGRDRLALDRIAKGKPPRRSAWTILGESIVLEKLGEAYRADRRRKRRRRALVGRR